jgi:hypothetical protein
MEAVIQKVMQTYCMMNTLTDEQAENAKLAVANYLANNPQEDEHRATVEGLTFLRSLQVH